MFEDGRGMENSLFVGEITSRVFAGVSASTSASTADALAVLAQEEDDFSEFSSHSTMLGKKGLIEALEHEQRWAEYLCCAPVSQSSHER